LTPRTGEWVYLPVKDGRERHQRFGYLRFVTSVPDVWSQIGPSRRRMRDFVHDRKQYLLLNVDRLREATTDVDALELLAHLCLLFELRVQEEFDGDQARPRFDRLGWLVGVRVVVGVNVQVVIAFSESAGAVPVQCCVVAAGIGVIVVAPSAAARMRARSKSFVPIP